MEFTCALRFEFITTDEEAEYEALITGLRMAEQIGVQELEARVNSRLVTNHILRELVEIEGNTDQYVEMIQFLIHNFTRFAIRQVPRESNEKADTMSRIASTNSAHLPKQFLVKIVKTKTIAKLDASSTIKGQPATWTTPIINFITIGTLPRETTDTCRV